MEQVTEAMFFFSSDEGPQEASISDIVIINMYLIIPAPI